MIPNAVPGLATPGGLTPGQPLITFNTPVKFTAKLVKSWKAKLLRTNS